jgi:DNA-binding NarL/FixJ family response regulator
MATAGPPADAPDSVRLLILDDHEMVVHGLATALGAAEGIEVVDMATTIVDAVEAAKAHQPDVALVDYRLTDGTGAEATRSIRAVSPDTAVVVITAFEGPDIVAASIEAGCAGFLSKNESLGQLLEGVRAAAKGETLFTPEMLAGLVSKLRNPKPVFGHDLSDRELEVLRLLAEGKSADSIAATLYVSKHTARNHIQNVLMKLDVHSQLEAVATALREGLITSEDLRRASP